MISRDVDVQLRLQAVLQSAMPALKLLFPMDAFHVRVQASATFQHFGTVRTLKLFFRWLPFQIKFGCQICRVPFFRLNYSFGYRQQRLISVSPEMIFKG